MLFYLYYTFLYNILFGWICLAETVIKRLHSLTTLILYILFWPSVKRLSQSFDFTLCKTSSWCRDASLGSLVYHMFNRLFHHSLRHQSPATATFLFVSLQTSTVVNSWQHIFLPIVVSLAAWSIRSNSPSNLERSPQSLWADVDAFLGFIQLR
jgi:hypothetical protein